MLRQSPYGFFSDGQVFGLFVPLPTAVLIGCTREANISLEAALGQIVFLVLFASGLTQGTKAP